MIRADGTSASAPPNGDRPGRSPRHAAGLIFTGEMYGVQQDQLADVLHVTERTASSVVAGWRSAGLADAGRLGPGPRWIWLTKAGLIASGLQYSPGAPGLSALAHLRAVTAVRLALDALPQYTAAGAYWRSERRLRAKIGGRLGLREHVPDAEVHWPDGAVGEDVPGVRLDAPRGDLAPVPWAGECWAIEAELTAKTVARTVAIMHELLSRTGDYGCPPADATVPGRPPRHTRAIYLCSPAARPTVSKARDALGNLAARIEIRPLPTGADLPTTSPTRSRPVRLAPPQRPAQPEQPAQPGQPAQVQSTRPDQPAQAASETAPP